MWRVLGIVDRMGQTLDRAVEYLREALRTMDAEMRILETRLHADAAELRRTVEGLDVDPEQKNELLVVSRRIEATALKVASFVHRPTDAEAQIDKLLKP